LTVTSYPPVLNSHFPNLLPTTYHMRSIKTKLILANSLLVIFLLGVTAFLLVDEKERELTGDIYVKSRSFAELTVADVVKNYEQFLKEDAFVYFQRALSDLFKKNEDISKISVFSYKGEYLFDSEQEKDSRYQGEPRLLDNQALLIRIQARNPSFLLDSGRTVYIKKDQEGDYIAVDEVEQPIEPVKDTEKIVDIVYPFEGKYAVSYGVSYRFLQERIVKTSERIVLLAIFGVLIGLAVGYLFSSTIINPLKKLAKSVLVIAQGNFKERIHVRSKDEVGNLAQSVNQMAQDLEKSTKALVYRERVAKELELAAKIQQELLPKKVPDITGVDLAAQLIPAAEIGGDCFDFISVDKQKTLMYVGDVTGHGVPSGLVVSIANALLYSFAQLKDLKEILIRTNTVLALKTSPNMFLTMLLVQWNSKTNELSYVSAGHEQMALFKASTKEVVWAPAGGIALGMIMDVSSLLKQCDQKMEKGDVAVLYSDGIPEAWANQKDTYGKERLLQAVKTYASLETAQSIKDGIISDVKTFMGSYPQADDITILVVKKK